MEEYILAIDQGTTSTRIILFNKAQEVVYVASKEIECIYPHSGWVEEDASAIYTSVYDLLSQLFQKTRISPKAIKAIGITNQRETTILWDKNTGIPVYNAIVWQSRQTSDIIKDYKEKGYEKLIKEKTGLVLDPYFSASKIKWIYDNVKGVKDNPDIIFGTVDTWLLWKLTGGTTHATDVSNASRTLLFNIHTLSWDKELCDLFAIPMSILPKVEATSHNFGKIDSKTFFGMDCPITSLVGDQQAALFGESCLNKGDIKNTYGTGGFILINTKDELILSKEGLLSTVAWKINDEVSYALEGSIFISGSLIQWLRDSLHLIEKAGDSEALALSVKDSAGVIIVPAFVGLGAPYWNDKCQASIFGLTRATDKRHIVRAALEAMAYQVYDLIKVIEREVDIKIDSLKVDGGASVNNYLLQFQSDLARIEVIRPEVKEATALGAARLAGLEIGYYTMKDFKSDKKIIYKPNDNSELTSKMYQRWLRALKSTIDFVD